MVLYKSDKQKHHRSKEEVTYLARGLLHLKQWCCDHPQRHSADNYELFPGLASPSSLTMLSRYSKAHPPMLQYQYDRHALHSAVPRRPTISMAVA
jgi:hypothetical protein